MPDAGKPRGKNLVSDKNESILERSNVFLRDLILSAVDAVIAADIKGKILIFNDVASDILGYSPKEVLTDFNIRDLYPNDLAREVMKKLRSNQYGKKGKIKSCQTKLLRKDGEVVPISLNASIIYENGKEVATIGFFHDMRESLRMKRDLEHAQIQLLQAEKMASLGKLAAGVAHQINNPLNGITLYARIVLEDYDLPEKVKEDLSRVLRNAERCRDIVRELLEFARQTSQEIQLRDLNKALSRTLFLLENQALFQNIEIIKELSSSLPAVPVDIQQINHVFMNIVLNAAEAMAGKGKLSVKSHLSPSGDRACVEISDTGPGIPDAVIDRIFDPFFTTKEEGKGTGLGLSIAYGIMENHNGSIRAESRSGEGTTFIIELPVHKKRTAADGTGD
jgi:PAS domain S-box-containing protein